MKTQILHEEELFIVCQKPAGFPVQSARLGAPDMESELKNYLCAKGEKSPYIAVIHRLDQPVQGVLVFAKTKAAAADLSKQLKMGKMKKIYRAFIYGIPEEPEGELKNLLIKESRGNLSKIISEAEYNSLPAVQKKEVKEALLSYRICENEPFIYSLYREAGGNGCELEINLATGRHHQIRAQMSAWGHPILGDLKYGTTQSEEEAKRLGITNLCLTAYRLSFLHPGTGKRMDFTFDSDFLPE